MATVPGTPGTILVHLLDSDGTRVLANSHSSKGVAVQVTDANGTGVGDAAVAFRFPDSGATAAFADGSHSAVVYTDATGTARIGNYQWNEQPGPVALRVTATKADSHAGLLVEQMLVTNASVSTPVVVQPKILAATEAPPALPEPVAAPFALSEPAAPTMVAPASAVNPYRIPRASIAPAISISSTDHDSGYHGGFNKKKWIILGIVAGVGAGAALALTSGKSGAAASGTSGVAVGSPTISIGHP
jgi:hypothetical protein